MIYNLRVCKNISAILLKVLIKNYPRVNKMKIRADYGRHVYPDLQDSNSILDIWMAQRGRSEPAGWIVPSVSV